MKKITLTLMLTVCLAFFLKAQNLVLVPSINGGAIMAQYPFNMSWGYSRTATIYDKADIGGSGTIFKLMLNTNAATPSGEYLHIKIKFKYSSTAQWGGTGTYTALSNGATTVFDGVLQFTSGYNYITLDTPFAYNNSQHLIVFFELDYGLTGSPSPISFTNYPIDSSTEPLTLFWGSNNNPPTGNGDLRDYQPLMGLFFNAPNQPSNMLVFTSCNGNQISWNNNANNDNVIIVGKLNDIIVNAPQCFENYTAGDSLGFGHYVVYAGPLTSTIHTPVIPGQTYYYKAWSFTSNKIYSSVGAVGALLSAFNQPYTANFDASTLLPIGWTASMSVMAGHGKTANGLVAQLQSPNIEKSASTPVFCNINANTVLEFYYRIVNIASYPATATPTSAMDSIVVYASTDDGHNNTKIYAITPATHTPSLNFVKVQVPLSAYSGQNVKLKLRCKRGSGAYFVDIDDFKILNPIGIKEIHAKLLPIYPNPANTEISIDLTNLEAGIYQGTVYDATGNRCLLLANLNNELIQANVSELPSGIYFIQITNNKMVYHARFMKQ